MDPLSIVISALTFAGIVQSGVNVLIRTHGAKPELFALSNELADLMVILKEGIQSYEIDPTAVDRNRELLRVVETTHNELEKLHQQLEEWAHSLKKNKLWAIIISSKLRAFHTNLQTQRSQLVAILTASSAVSLDRVRLDLRRIYAVVDQLAIQNASLEAKLIGYADNLDIITSRLESIHSRLGLNDDNIYTATTVVEEPHFGNLSTTDLKSSSAWDSDKVTSTLLDVCKGSETGGVAITASVSSRRRCKGGCTCVCHQRQSYRSYRFLKAVLGSLFIGYSGQPKVNVNCNVSQCANNRPSKIEFTYIFPRWFMARMISAVMTSISPQGTRAVFRVHRTLDGNADLFNFAKFGQIQKLQSLFSSGMGSPNDVHFESGVTALDFAISFRRLETIKFLLNSGADPFLRAVTGGSPIDKAWTMVLSKALTLEEEEAFRVMFAQAEDLEDKNLTILHEIVLGLTQGSLADELEAQTTDVDAQDSIGLTALAMAAKRGDAESIKLLLMHGADPNIPSHSGKDALCYAAKKNDLACVTLLVNGGAKVTNRTVYQQTALHFAALHCRDERFADLLLNAGADMNAADRDRRTPLGFTPLHNNVDFASCLLNRGVTIRCPGSPPAVDPLIQAIRGNRYELLELFIEHGFDIDVPLPKGQTLLHIIAEWADEEAMDMLSRCKLGHLPVGKADDEGLTALDIVRSREEDSHAMTQCFLKMLESSLSDGIQGSDELKSTSRAE